MLILLFAIACSTSTPTTEMSHGDHEGHEMTESHEMRAEHDHAGEVTADVYACPMHPEETLSEPGACSKCGMDLVKVDADAKATEAGHDH